MWSIKTCMFFFGFVGACALSVVYPIVGIVNYMMVYQMNPNTMWWGIPLEPFGIRYSMAAAVCLILGMLVSVGRVPKSRVFFGDWYFLLLLFTAIVLFSGRTASGSNYGVVLSDKMVKMAIFIFCMIRMGSTLKNFKIILYSLVAGTMVLGYDAFTAPAGDFIRGRLNFVGGSDFRESSGLATHMAAMLPLVGVMVFVSRSWVTKIGCLVAGVLAVNTIIQCRTRSAFIGLLVGAAVALIMAPRGRRGRIYVALILGVAGGYTLTDAPFRDRMVTAVVPKFYAEDMAIQARMELWSVAGKMFLEHPFGVGVGRFKDALQEYRGYREDYNSYSLGRRVTHNTYLLCLTELGIQGTTLLLLLIVLSFCKIRCCALKAPLCDKPDEAKMLSYGVLLSLVIYLSAASFTDRLYTESFWWVLVLPICLEKAIKLKLQEQDAVAILVSDSQPVNVDMQEYSSECLFVENPHGLLSPPRLPTGKESWYVSTMKLKEAVDRKSRYRTAAGHEQVVHKSRFNGIDESSSVPKSISQISAAKGFIEGDDGKESDKSNKSRDNMDDIAFSPSFRLV